MLLDKMHKLDMHTTAKQDLLIAFEQMVTMVLHTKSHLSILWRVVIEQGYQMPCQLPVCGVIDLVQHQVDEVKPGHQARGQLDIVNDADAWVVAAAYWVGACQDTSPGIQGSDDAGLGHRHCLLLHHLMQLHEMTPS